MSMLIGMRLLVDENLAGVTRWLRFFGFDTIVASGWTDEQVVAEARKDGRIVVTRDSDLLQFGYEPVIHVRSDDLRKQLAAILGSTGCPGAEFWFSRCSTCNQTLIRVARWEALESGKLPLPVRLSQDGEFLSCRGCSRLYWKGSHYERTRQFLESVRAAVSKEPDEPMEAAPL